VRSTLFEMGGAGSFERLMRVFDGPLVPVGGLFLPWVIFVFLTAPLSTVPLIVLMVVLVGILLVFVWRPRVWQQERRRLSVLALVSSVSLFVACFSMIHWSISKHEPRSFSQPEVTASDAPRPLTKVDATYFTLTVFTTTGFGDIAPRSQDARLAVTAQMGLGIVLVGFVLTTAAARLLASPPT